MPADTAASGPIFEPGFTRWPWWRRWFGQRSERSAARYFQKLGYSVLAANVSDPTGELDLLLVDGQTLVVVEVRSTASDRPDSLVNTAASVDLRKQRRITGATLRFLAARKMLGLVRVRFDVLVVGWPSDAKEPRFQHIANAFQAPGSFQFFN